LKKTRQKQKQGKTKKQISKIQKTQKQNKRGNIGKTKERQKGKNMEKQWICPFAFFLHLFCFLDLFFLVAFCLEKKKSKIKAKTKQIRKSEINATKMQMDKSFFFPGCFSLFDVPFFPIYFASVFFPVLKFCFLIFHVFPFLHFFKFKNH